MRQDITAQRTDEIKKRGITETNYSILWDQFENDAALHLRFGIKKARIPLINRHVQNRQLIQLFNSYVKLDGEWSNLDKNNPAQSVSVLRLRLKNIHHRMICISALVFPAENGLDRFLGLFSPQAVSFLQNGYQSWSPVRSYRVNEKPFCSWFHYVPLMTSNTANLHSNRRGHLSSEMYTVITNNAGSSPENSFFIGQLGPFNQLFYISLILHKSIKKRSRFQIAFDFGNKILKPGEEIDLDGIYLAQGAAINLLKDYFNYIKYNDVNRNGLLNSVQFLSGEQKAAVIPEKNTKGWCTWYCYKTGISPELILTNLKAMRDKNLPLDYVQIDDGYEKIVGDWLDLKSPFIGKMQEIALAIREAGYQPAIWLAPFIADKKSKLAEYEPNMLLRAENGRLITAGKNPDWPGIRYYTLDITHPLFAEYLKEVIHTFVHEWGYQFLKLDFLYAICLEEACPIAWKLSRAEIFKSGLDIIRQAAGPDVKLLGCGAPLTPSIGYFDSMRIGMDTAPRWATLADVLLMTGGSIVGAKNNIRNTLVRSFMNKKLWVNDPDCLMVRTEETSLNPAQRQTDINAKLLAGGLLMFSDDLVQLGAGEWSTMEKIIHLSEQMYQGEAWALDVMERSMPQVFYNTAGYLGLFNFSPFKKTQKFDLTGYPLLPQAIKKLVEVWTNLTVEVPDNKQVVLPDMPAHGSYLFQIRF